jgi:ketosteroid isomerase-like protein
MSEHNKAIARIEFEVWSSGELDRLEELVADDVVHHDPYDPHAAEGLKGLKKTIAMNRRAFPDMQITIEDQVVESWRSMDTLGLLRGIGALPGA